jgi:para-aminobenzoate synthetase component II
MQEAEEAEGKRILVLDNYDSFTYNLVQYLGELGAHLIVRRSRETTLKEIEQLAPRAILISPGPGAPEEAGISLETIEKFAGRIPLFGVCLGHQAIAQAFGGRIVRSPAPVHGKSCDIAHDGRTIFKSIPSPFRVARYHSLAVEPESFPSCLEISAVATTDGAIMGLRHRELKIEGVQFHPESILTGEGKRLISNWLRRQ